MKKIRKMRRQIDAVDRRLLDLFNRRTRLARHIAEEKRRNGLSLRSPEREQSVLSRARTKNNGPLDDTAVARLFRAILRESRKAARRHLTSRKSREAAR